MQSAPVSGQCQNSTEFQYETDQWPRGILADYAIRVRAALVRIPTGERVSGARRAGAIARPVTTRQVLGAGLYPR